MPAQAPDPDRSDDPRRVYWNHNSAYHPWIERIARTHPGSALDIGCGEGLLLQRLAAVCTSVTGIEVDQAAVRRARARLAGTDHVAVLQSDVAEYDAQGRYFDIVTFVASLHHLPLEGTLRQAAALLKPGGDLLVVGVAARESAVDWVLSGLAIPIVRTANRLHRETRDVGVPVATPRESLREIQSTARAVLPGVRIRRALYYRYLLRWTKPGTS